MRELVIRHVPGGDGQQARVWVSYRAEAGAQAQEREAAFAFEVVDDERRLIQMSALGGGTRS